MTPENSASAPRPGRTSTWSSGWALDLRSLAVFRMLLGGAVLFGALHRMELVTPFFSEEGVLPAADAAQGHTYRWWHFSLFLQFHSLAGTTTLLALIAGAGLLLALGWRTWWMTLVCWIGIGSLQARNPMILHAGDTLEILLLFWSLFLPLGARFSLDARRQADRGTDPTELASVGTSALLGQALIIYWIAGITKLLSPAWLDGSYLPALLQGTSSPVQSFIASNPVMGQVLTYLTLAIEFVAPVLLISPWRRDACRTIAILSLAALQLGIFLALPLGTFPLLNVAHLAAFVPGLWWGKARVSPAHERLPVGWLRARSLIGWSALGLVLLWNVAGLLQARLPAWINAPVSALALQQRWHVFTHDPGLRTWIAAPAHTDAGRVVDLARMGAPFTMTGFPTDSLMQSNYRWRLFLGGNLVPAPPDMAARVGARLLDYLVDEWSLGHPSEPIEQAALLRCWSREDAGVRSEPISEWRGTARGRLQANPPAPAEP